MVTCQLTEEDTLGFFIVARVPFRRIADVEDEDVTFFSRLDCLLGCHVRVCFRQQLLTELFDRDDEAETIETESIEGPSVFARRLPRSR